MGLSDGTNIASLWGSWPILVPKLRAESIRYLLRGFLNVMLAPNGQDASCDIAETNIKTIMYVYSPALPSCMIEVFKGLMSACREDIAVSRISRCVALACDIARIYGSHMNETDVDSLAKLLCDLFMHAKSTVRGKTLQGFSVIAMFGSDAIFDSIATFLEGKLEHIDSASLDLAKAAAAGLTHFVKDSGTRWQSRASELASRLMLVVSQEVDEDVDEFAFDELREELIYVLSYLVEKCSSTLAPSIVLQLHTFGLHYIKHDPNHVEQDEGSDDDEFYDDEDDDGGDFDNDEDVSWKVRSRAARLLGMLYARYSRLLEVFWESSSELFSSMSEREEIVLLDILGSLRKLLAVSRFAPKGPALLSDRFKQINGALVMVLKAKSPRIKHAAFACMRDVCLVLPTAFCDHPGTLRKFVETTAPSMAGNTANYGLVTEGLLCLQQLFHNYAGADSGEVVSIVVQPLLLVMASNYYKVSVEALKVGTEIAAVLKAFRALGSHDAVAGFATAVHPIFEVTLQQLNGKNIPLDVKEAALSCLGAMTVALNGRDIGTAAWDAILVHLRSDVDAIRVAALGALRLLLSSESPFSLKSSLDDLLELLSTFMKKSHVGLRVSAMECILTVSRAETLSPGQFDLVASLLQTELSGPESFLVESAMRVAQALLAGEHRDATLKLLGPLMPSLATGTVTRASTLQIFLALLKGMVEADVEAGSKIYRAILENTLEVPTASKHMLQTVGECLATVLLTGPTSQYETMMGEMLQGLETMSLSERESCISLVTLGICGRERDLPHPSALLALLSTAFDSESVEIRTSAYVCLGNIIAGSPTVGLPLLSRAMETEKHRYVAIHALKEAIPTAQTPPVRGGEYLKANCTGLLDMLFSHCDEAEEGVRVVLAECLGLLLTLSPAAGVERAVARLEEGDWKTRACVVMATKFAYAESDNAVLREQLATHMPAFMKAVDDAHPYVRRAALLMITYFARHEKGYVIQSLDLGLLTSLLQQCRVNFDLVRVVDLGDGLYVTDDGVDVRKAAYECLNAVMSLSDVELDYATVLEAIVYGLEVYYDVPNVSKKLENADDVQVLCLHILGNLDVAAHHKVLVDAMHVLADRWRAIVTKALPGKAPTIQQIERHDDLVRTVLRVVIHMGKSPELEKQGPFRTFLQQVVMSSEPLKVSYATLQAEGK